MDERFVEMIIKARVPNHEAGSVLAFNINECLRETLETEQGILVQSAVQINNLDHIVFSPGIVHVGIPGEAAKFNDISTQS